MATWRYPIELYSTQREAVASPADQVLFGGSLAGGKTEMILKHMVDICLLIPGAKVLVVRRNFPQMVEVEQRLRLRIPKQVATMNLSKHVMTFKHNGAELHLGFLDSDDAAERYQGHQYVQIGYDELTHYDESWVNRLNERLRDAERVGVMREHGLKIRMLAASNPGSRGHVWVKERFIDPAPAGEVFSKAATDLQGNPLIGRNGKPIVITRQFIPSSLWDNPHQDPDEYLATIADMDPERKRAMVYGDWGIPSGTRFSRFRESIHTIKPDQFPIPVVGAVRVVGVDYGTDDPMAAVWLAKVGNQIIAYRNHVESGMSSSEQAKKVRELENEDERLHSDVTVALDPNAWARNMAYGGPKLSPGSDEAPLGSMAYFFREALGDRVVKGWNPREQGWALIDELLVERDTGLEDEKGNPVKLPRLLIYDDCRELIKAIQAAPVHKKKPGDIQDPWKHDHVLDALRYGCAELLGMRYQTRLPASAALARAAGNRPVTAGVQSASF